MEELEAKISFLQEKSKKASEELKEEKELHQKAVDKLNLSLAFNQKLETYVRNTGDVVNEAQLFDANLAQHPVTAKKVIPVLVDFADKMEELLDEMRVLFDGLLPEVLPLAAENLPDISGDSVCSQADPRKLTSPKKSLCLSVQGIQFQKTKIGD